MWIRPSVLISGKEMMEMLTNTSVGSRALWIGNFSPLYYGLFFPPNSPPRGPGFMSFKNRFVSMLNNHRLHMSISEDCFYILNKLSKWSVPETSMEYPYTCKPTGKFVEILKIILTVQELVPTVRVRLHNRMKQHNEEGSLDHILFWKLITKCILRIQLMKLYSCSITKRKSINKILKM